MNDDRFNYDSIAADYAARVDSAPWNALYERPAMIAMLPPVDGLRILDAGCGSGWYAERLLERGATVDCIDASARMAGFARQRLQGLDESKRKRVTIQVASLDSRLPFDDSVFHGAVSPLVLHYIPDWRPALREIRRVLLPGGWLLFSTHHPSADAARFGTTDYFATEHVKDYWSWVGDVEFYRRSLTEIFASLKDSGFRVDEVAEPAVTEEFRMAEPESALRLERQPEFLVIKSIRADP